MKNPIPVACLLALALADSTPASAQARYHLEIPILALEKQMVEVDGTELGSVTVISIGPVPTSLGFGVGVFTSDSIVFGANIALARQTISPEDGDSVSLTAIVLRPYLEFLFGDPHDDTRPFVGPVAGILHRSIEDNSSTGYEVGAIAGAHFMLAEGGSLDFGGRVTYGVVDDEDVDISTISIAVVLGVSVWSI